LQMKIAFIQFAPAYLDRDANLSHVEAMVDAVDADLVVLPELFTSGYFFQSTSDAAQLAEPIPEGPTTDCLTAWARASEATYVAGLPEQEGNRLFNSAVVVGPDGFAGRYRKVHLFNEEKEHFTPGDEGFSVFTCQSRNGTSYRLGLMICFDWYFPEAARSLALQGADVIAHPSNLVLPYCPDSMPVRARENHVFTVTANRHGAETRGEDVLSFIGNSEVCGPTGDILMRAPESEDVVGVVDIDPHEARDRQINSYNDVLMDRRPDSYETEPQTVDA